MTNRKRDNRNLMEIFIVKDGKILRDIREIPEIHLNDIKEFN